MKFTRHVALSVLALPLTVLAQSASAPSSSTAVATHGSLVQSLDTSKNQVGSEFKVKLEKSAQLSNGTSLPAGSMLVGNVVSDDSQNAGSSKLAVRFTHVTLKNGQVVPVKGTIVGVAQTTGDAGDKLPARTSIDQMGAMKNVDLHSKMDGNNSGVFVSNKSEVKIAGGTEMQLAISPDAQKTTDIAQPVNNNN